MSERGRSANDELAAMVASQPPSDVPADDDKDGQKTVPCLLLRLGERWCAVRAESVREVVAIESITRVPTQLSHILGVLLVHGRLVPVVDFAILAQKPDMALHKSPGRRLVVLQRGDMEIGLVADDAEGVIDLPALAEGEPAPSERRDSVVGEVQWQSRLVCYLDAEHLLDVALGAERI